MTSYFQIKENSLLVNEYGKPISWYYFLPVTGNEEAVGALKCPRFQVLKKRVSENTVQDKLAEKQYNSLYPKYNLLKGPLNAKTAGDWAIDYDGGLFIAAKTRKPKTWVCWAEHNLWGHESWNYYFEYESNVEAYQVLGNLLASRPPHVISDIERRYGVVAISRYKMSFPVYSEAQVSRYSAKNTGGYLQKYNLPLGKISLAKLSKASFENGKDPFYKGGIRFFMVGVKNQR